VAAGAAALVVLAGLSACSSGPVGRSAAATVEGHEISASTVTDLLEAQERYVRSRANAKGADAQAKQSALDSLAAMRGTGKDAWSTSEAASALSAFIFYEVVAADLADHGEQITDADRTQARQALVGRVGTEADLKKVPKLLVDLNVRTGAAQTALARVVAGDAPESRPGAARDARLRKLWEQSNQEQPLCLRVIMGSDRASAQAARDRVDAGEDFAAVAADASEDASAAQGGDVGCLSVDQATQSVGEDFSSAKVGDLFGPVQLNDSQGVPAFFVIQVSSTTGQPFEDAKADLETTLDETLTQESQTSVQDYLAKLLKKASVTVDPRYGRWDPDTGTVVAPGS
jgi:hypothetical protein